ncbi:MAG: histidine phosphatase family protein [Solirubrobacterales bacterium]|nr:histidine phosphatase family protein [Solirubrobacterales bacterium]
MTASKRLFVLRHAKSSWDDPGLADHERPLTPRGRRALKALASYMQARGIEPELVLCSSSRRTRETLDGIAVGGEHVIERTLYEADTDEVLERLRRLPVDISSVMLIGHNPVAQMLVLRLTNHDADGAADPGREEVKRKFPTGALASLTVSCGWRELAPGCARLNEFTSPKGFSAAPEAVAAIPAPRASTAAR